MDWNSGGGRVARRPRPAAAAHPVVVRRLRLRRARDVVGDPRLRLRAGRGRARPASSRWSSSLPPSCVAPFAAYAGDRFRPERVLALGYAAQALSMFATAAAMWADRPLLAYATGAVVATCVTFSRPVMGAILPIVARTPNDLVAANVVTGLTEYVGMFVGPLVAAVMLADGDAGGRLRDLRRRRRGGCAAVVASAIDCTTDLPGTLEIDAGGVLTEMLGGLRALAEHGTMRVLVVMVGVGRADQWRHRRPDGHVLRVTPRRRWRRRRSARCRPRRRGGVRRGRVGGADRSIASAALPGGQLLCCPRSRTSRSPGSMGCSPPS